MSPAETDALNAIRIVVIILAGFYMVFAVIRWISIQINRGIDWDGRHGDRDGRRDGRDGHHRYRDHDEHDDIGELHENWIARRHQRDGCDDPRDPAAHMGSGVALARRSPGMTGMTNRPGLARDIARRPALPVVTVAHGAYAGCRVRLVMESRGYPGTWVAEVVEGNGRSGEPGAVGRGVVMVVEGDWLG